MKKYGQNVSINITKIDLNKKQVPDLGVKTDLVVTNFAFHYFYKNMEVYIKSVKNNLTSGGFLLMTFFDGELVKDIKNENYELIVENDQVEVRIKDSILDTPDKENIVDIKTVVNFLKSNGLVLVENVNFRDLYQDWKKLGRNSLTKEEKDLSFLNVALVFRMV
jgi:phosphoserine aminotransferase